MEREDRVLAQHRCDHFGFEFVRVFRVGHVSCVFRFSELCVTTGKKDNQVVVRLVSLERIMFLLAVLSDEDVDAGLNIGIEVLAFPRH